MQNSSSREQSKSQMIMDMVNPIQSSSSVSDNASQDASSVGIPQPLNQRRN